MSANHPVIAYVGLGANLGNPMAALKQALHALEQTPGISAVRASSFYRSAPVDAKGPDFINAVAELLTDLTAPQVLQALQRIEDAAGRERPFRNAPRTLDLDLLLYGDARTDSPTLTVPHPRMEQRAFVLVPLAELAPARVSALALRAVADQSLSVCDQGASRSRTQS